jgi:hypothetical protein
MERARGTEQICQILSFIFKDLSSSSEMSHEICNNCNKDSKACVFSVGGGGEVAKGLHSLESRKVR